MANPKLIMTYLVRNEANIIEDGIRFHAAQGVDRFIIMDNLSTDDTRKTLERLSDEFPIDYIFQSEDDYRQSEWVTMMARKAATEYDADWVISSDADEFWVTSQDTLKNAIAKIPPSVGVARVQRHNAAMTRWNNVKPFNAQSHPMINTVFENQSLNSNLGPLPPKVIHRARADITVHQGNHSTSSIEGQTTEESTAIRILHFPYQSLNKYKSKILLGGAAYARNDTYPESVGATWRAEYKKITSGDINLIWESIPRTENDAYIGLQDGSLFQDSTVYDFLHAAQAIKTKLALEQAKKNLVAQTQEAVDRVKEKIVKALALQSGDIRTNSPLYNNMKYSLQGPQQQLSVAQDISTKYSYDRMIESFSFLRDSYSLFPENHNFKYFIQYLFNSANVSATNRLAHDCKDRIVILHVTCDKYTDRAIASVNSFLDQTEGKYHHIIVKGFPSKRHEDATPMTITYDGLFLTVPVSDSYEALNRKVFYALMALHFAASPCMVIKLDDDLHLEDMDIFDDVLTGIIERGSQYCGRRVGALTHSGQWHGWHIGKCSSDGIESRGYTYPLPRSYAAGGYGYILRPQAIESAANMYLGMKEFFNLKAVGLEDAYIGHAMYAQNIEIDDISDPKNVRSIPGLKIRAS
tara:strand:- start:1047 stop:2957 length:1911 start_codon:yes stop_codon:yes gene_type:complete